MAGGLTKGLGLMPVREPVAISGMARIALGQGMEARLLPVAGGGPEATIVLPMARLVNEIHFPFPRLLSTFPRIVLPLVPAFFFFFF